jgi:hypothetical protein
MAYPDTKPDDRTIALYRSLPDGALMLLRTAFEHDATRLITALAREFITGRIALIDSIIDERIRYDCS